MEINFYILNRADTTEGIGYAAEHLNGEDGLLEVYGERVTVVNLEKFNKIERVDLLVVEDDPVEMKKVIKAADESRSIQSVGLCYDHRVLGKVVELAKSGPKVMTLDVLLSSKGGIEPKALIHDTTVEALRKITDSSSWDATVILGISNYAREEIASEVEQVLNQKRQKLYKKSSSFYQTLPDMLVASLNEYETNQVHQEKLKVKDEESAFVVAMEEKFKGIRSTLTQIWEIIEPFYLWKRGEYDNIPESLRPKFISAFKLIGETGAGKTSLVEEIERWLGCQIEEIDLRRTQFVSDRAMGSWRGQLQRVANDVYGVSRDLQTPDLKIVHCDDFKFPDVTKVSDEALAEDFRNFQLQFRKCIFHADHVNDGVSPPELSGMTDPQNLKILWIFTLNKENEMGSQFAPLLSSIFPINLEFPRDKKALMDILKLHAGKNHCTFEVEALEYLVDNVLSFQVDTLSRELFGYRGTGGLITAIIQKSRKRYRDIWSQTKKEDKVRITKDDVKSILETRFSSDETQSGSGRAIFSDSVIPEEIKKEFRHETTDIETLNKIIKAKPSILPKDLANKYGIGGNAKTQGLQNKFKKFSKLLNSLPEDLVKNLWQPTIDYVEQHHGDMILNKKNGFPEWMRTEAEKIRHENKRVN